MKNKENSLAVLRPDLAQQWHSWRNGDLKPEDVTCGSKRRVWWYLPYEDKKTGKKFEFEWEATIDSRNRGAGCPYLSGNKVHPDFNSLAVLRPNLALQWHNARNGQLKPENVTCSSNKKVWWLLPYKDSVTGKSFIFEWEATISDRAIKNRGCPYISNQKVLVGFNDLKTLRPDLALQWHETKNGQLKPTDVTCSSSKKVWWYLPYKDNITGKSFVFEWMATVANRNKGEGCPFLSGKQIYKGYNDLATTHPRLCKEWNFDRNKELTPEQVTKGSKKIVWWKTIIDEKTYEWKASIDKRVRGCYCPELGGSNLEKIVFKILKNKK